MWNVNQYCSFCSTMMKEKIPPIKTQSCIQVIIVKWKCHQSTAECARTWIKEQSVHCTVYPFLSLCLIICMHFFLLKELRDCSLNEEKIINKLLNGNTIFHLTLMHFLMYFFSHTKTFHPNLLENEEHFN